ANAEQAASRLAEAAAAWREAAQITASLAPMAYYQAAHPALWAGDLEAARQDLAAIDATGVHGRVVELRRRTVQAGIAALEGRAADALGLYRDALRGWGDLGLVWDEALTAIDMATLLDPAEPDVRAAADVARATLVRLGAAPYLDRLDAALTASRPARARTRRIEESAIASGVSPQS
ncbi:MAG TPA: hypothetical protein VJ141_03000, partial [Candidatus Limnocylindrales bacterium]|nr:hypothetical protein [Candidatus Limnocylindrales bacterium]